MIDGWTKGLILEAARLPRDSSGQRSVHLTGPSTGISFLQRPAATHYLPILGSEVLVQSHCLYADGAPDVVSSSAPLLSPLCLP